MNKNKILVVDDEPDFLKMMKIRLEANNYEVALAENGKEALRQIKENKPDAVLLDILMPDLDGFEVLKKIREHDKDLPVFIVTAFSNEERFKMAGKFLASGFIVKTGDLKTEVDNISNILSVANKYRSK